MRANPVTGFVTGAAVGFGAAYLILRREQREDDDAQGMALGVVDRVEQVLGDESVTQRFNDATLARKVESEIFPDENAPNGSVSIDAENGIVYLRGTLKRSKDIKAVEQAARAVDGVEHVRNYLHQPV